MTVRVARSLALPVFLFLVACGPQRAPQTEVEPVRTATPAPEPEVVEAIVFEDPLPVALPADPEAEPRPEDPAPEEPISESPHDELVGVDPELSPETAARVEDEVGEPAEPTYDVPIVVNKKVLFWIDYYAHRYPSRYVKGLERSGRYVERFRQIFAEAGVPQDLVYMAHVESAYKVTAYSRAKAKGIYQFIAATGRRYDLRIDYWVDERSDPEKAARASAAYLRDLYDEFGDWYLALAGYNAGEGKIRRAIRRTGSRDFWKIARSRYIRKETKNYVPAILASILISKDPQKYGFDVNYDEPLVYDVATVEGAADLKILARCAGTDLETLRALNPALRRLQTPPDGTTEVRVPLGSADTMLAALAEIPQADRVLYARHRVRSGETLSTIARRYGSSVRAIQSSNGMGRRTLIRVGQVLKIPSGSYSGARYAAADAPAPGADGVVNYRVRRGDSLWKIANTYGTTPAAIARQNGISVHATLRVGQRLTVVPRGVAAPAAAAKPRWDATTTYRVRSGDTLSAIAQRHGTTASRLAAANDISLRSTLSVGQRLKVPRTDVSLPAGETLTYRVRRGDSLWEIARRYGTTPRAIAAQNGISVRSTLRIGQQLTVVVPGATGASSTAGEALTHKVRRGDSLWKIAQRYNTSIDRLCALNGISRRATLRPGTTLTVRLD